MQYAGNPKTQIWAKHWSPVDSLAGAGSTGDTKNSARAQNEFFSSPLLRNSMIEGPNQVQISPNFVGMITKDLWTYPRKESTNHSMIWEESREYRARTGFSQERKNFVSKELVNPSRFVLSKEWWIHYKGLREVLRSRASWSHKRKPKFVTNKAPGVRDRNEIKSPKGTRREGPPFPFNLSTSTQKSIAKNLP